ncbi:4-(cytidine 5'-diphospho)-2-C-methyl-D-erythritol kinase [Planctomycetota bacterium]|nr:4-(cytidine 5'-diphospho)-2-C-methyl-D-erythritol kinase [Planctomycetota bacterium]
MTSTLMHVEPGAEAEILCPAKVNLALSVGAPFDNGYHPIASWMVATDFEDQLSIQCIESDDKSHWHIHFADDAPVRQTVDWEVESDLIYKAHHLIEKQLGKKLPAVEVTLSKHIPAGAGLGGGSSDAAGMLVGLNELFELHLSEETLLKLGAELGCDVAFAVSVFLGRPSALATGFGEVIESSKFLNPVYMTLILPSFGCPTKDVYGKFDQIIDPSKVCDRDEVVALMKSGDLIKNGPFNDLADAAMQAQPQLAEAKQKIEEVLSRPVHVTGSGSAMFVVAESEDDAREMRNMVIESCNIVSVTAKTLEFMH